MNKLIPVLAIIFLIGFSSALSETAINASKVINEANISINEMKSREIPTGRVSELMTEAYEVYESQLLIEKFGRRTVYDIVFDNCEEILNISEKARKVQDELNIFLETYNEAASRIDMSGMQEEYEEIMSSFNEERFEETKELIDEGYDALSEVEASQTKLNLFYSSTSQNIKQFFEDYWEIISIVAAILIVLFFIFKSTIKRFRIKLKIKSLNMQKDTLDELIRDLQKRYFESDGISGMEYNIKMKKFKEMIRDINRQIPLLTEEIWRLNKKKGGKKALMSSGKSSEVVIRPISQGTKSSDEMLEKVAQKKAKKKSTKKKTAKKVKKKTAKKSTKKAIKKTTKKSTKKAVKKKKR